MYYPKISVIMPSYNRVEVIEQAISSVVNQTYKNIEFIIIDGASTDGTLDILKKYDSLIDYWCSEKDNGIYHAANKALDHATGDYFIWLSTDDSFTNVDIIERAVKELDETVDVLSGWIYFVSDNGYEHFGKNMFAVNKETYPGGMIPMEGIFWRTELVKTYKFDESYKIAGDYKLFLQLYYNDNVKFKFINLPITYFATTGVSSQTDLCKEENHRIYKELNLPQFIDRDKKHNIIRTILKLCKQKHRRIFYFFKGIKDRLFWHRHHCSNKICRWCGRT